MTWRPSSEQQAVIDHPLNEPLRVAAGAGTGKTSTIVMRLQQAVEVGIPPESALGLTFTNKAAQELADRLRQALGDRTAEGSQVEVTTYHSFAYGLLREFGAYIGVERDSRLIGPGYVRQLIQEELGSAAEYDYLDLTHPPTRVADAAALMRRLADNLLGPEALTDRTFLPGDVVAGRRHELATLVNRVLERKRAMHLIDFGDLVLLVHQLLADHPAVAAKVRDRYQIVLLDEYQDTDPGQREMLRSIFGEGFPLTAVGDSDQTIYEWRGASLANFHRFPQHFPTADGTPATTMPLTNNRRSATPILDLANAVRRRLHGENAVPLTPADPPAGAVHVARHHSAGDEAVAIAEEISRLAAEEGVSWSDIAILFRKNAQISLVRDALEAYDVPFEVASLGGLLTVPVVADLRAWLSIIADPAESPSLLRILLGGSYRLGLADLKPLADWASRSARDEEGIGRPLLEAIDNIDDALDATRGDLAPEIRTRLDRFIAIYRALVIDAQGLSLVELSRRVLEVTDSWREIDAMAPNASLTARLNMYRFLDLAEEWSPLQGRPSLDAFLGYLTTLDEEAAAQELDMARVGDENVVALLTIHRAKGLEWDYVFMPAVVAGTLPSSNRGGDNPAKTPSALPFDMRIDLDRTELAAATTDPDGFLRSRHEAQELRTAYVGVTRAKRHLYLSGAHWYTEKRAKKLSPIMEDALSIHGVDIGEYVADEGDAPGMLALETVSGAPDPVFPDGWAAAVRAEADQPGTLRESAGDASAYDGAMHQTELMLDSLPQPPQESDVAPPTATSVTGLVTLAGCPQQFYWSEVDPLPRRSSRAMRRGVEVHRAIELYARGQVPLWDVAADLYDTTQDDVPARGTSPFDVFLTSRFAGRRARFVEVPLDLAMETGRIRGRIDAVYENDPGNWEIVDWKSGRSSEDPSRLVQLQAYAVAAARGLIGDQVPDTLVVTFCYLGGEAPVEVSYQVTSEWLDAAENDLESWLQKAAGPSYQAQPGPRCQSCDFSRFCEAGTAWLAESGD